MKFFMSLIRVICNLKIFSDFLGIIRSGRRDSELLHNIELNLSFQKLNDIYGDGGAIAIIRNVLSLLNNQNTKHTVPLEEW